MCIFQPPFPHYSCHYLYFPFQTLSNINQLLDKADGVYKELVQHRNQMDSLLVALASGTVVISRSGVQTCVHVHVTLFRACMYTL